MVDLRVGDEVLYSGRWQRVLGIDVWCELMLTDEEAAAHAARPEADDVMGGWLVKAPEGYVSPLTGGSVRKSTTA
jgi:hypothetical protein